MFVRISLRGVLLASAASVGLIVGGLSFTDASFAQKGAFMSPSTQWAVSKVPSKVGDSSGYCAVARRFNGNAIMTLARNQGEQTSFALDFQRPTFTLGQSVEVTLDPGAGEQRVQSIEPSSQQAFVVKLGYDQGFLNAIDKTGMLRVEVSGESYIFNISDIDVGQVKLKSCLSELARGSGVAQNSYGGGPDGAPSGGDYSREVERLKSEVSALEAKNRTMRAQLGQSDRGVSPTSESVKRLSQRIGTLEGQNRELRIETQKLRQDSYKDSLDKTAENQVERLLEEREDLRKRLDLALGNQREQSSLVEKIATLEVENLSLAESLRKAEDELNSGFSEQISARKMTEAEAEQLVVEKARLAG